MEKEFIPYQEALDLKELGFDEPCFGFYGIDKRLHITGSSIVKYKPKLHAPTFSQAFRWFRDKYDLHVQIRKENYMYKNIHSNYFHFDISKGEQNDITEQQELYSKIMQECSQDIPGNHLNNEKLNILIFEKDFAFKTYEETELTCLKELIKLTKNKLDL